MICEIEDFEEGDIDRNIRMVVEARMAECVLPGGYRGGWAAGCWDSSPRIQRTAKHAAEQLRPFKGDYPCVVVLHNAGSFTDLAEPLVMRALFGGIHSAPSPDRLSPLLNPKKNTTLSAVAVIETFRPNQHIVENALAEQNTKDTAAGLPLQGRMVRGLETIDALNVQYGEAFLQEAHPYLRIIHNPFAAKPLDPVAFRGPRDEHYRFDPLTGIVARI